MSEVYPDDNSLLNMVSDVETGVEYIETGKAPYYLEFRKLMYRLLLAGRRANDLRVFDEGGLQIGIKGGSFWNGRELIHYASSSGHVLADDKAVIYVYLDGQGNLVTNEYMGFPEPSVNHVRLARVTTSAGDIVNIEDCRGQHYMGSFAPALADSVIHEAALGSQMSSGITVGAAACKRIGTTELKALLDGNVHNLFAVNAGDIVLQVVLCVQSASGLAGTIDIGFDSAADGTADNQDGWLKAVDANSVGIYSSNQSSLAGVYASQGGREAATVGNVTIKASTDLSGSSFAGGAWMVYIAA